MQFNVDKFMGELDISRMTTGQRIVLIMALDLLAETGDKTKLAERYGTFGLAALSKWEEEECTAFMGPREGHCESCGKFYSEHKEKA